MNHPKFTELRRRLDRAITYHDMTAADACATEGLELARQLGILGEEKFFQAQFLIMEDRFEEAVSVLAEALSNNPEDGAAFNDLALCQVELGRLDMAVELFDQGIAVESDYATIWHNKGWLLNKLGQYAESLACFQKALAIEADRAVTYENMADVYESLGRVPEALSAYKKSLELMRDASSQISRQLEREIKRLEGA